MWSGYAHGKWRLRENSRPPCRQQVRPRSDLLGPEPFDVSALHPKADIQAESKMSKMRIYILAAVAAAGIGLGGTFGASAVPMNGNLVGATAPAPELQKVYYYHRYARRHYRYARRHYRRAYRRGYYGGYYRGY